MNDYKAKLWDEIARNSPPDAKALSALKTLNPKLMKFRWLHEPQVLLCKYVRREHADD